MNECFGLVTPRKRVKHVKNILESHDLLHKSLKITTYTGDAITGAGGGPLSILPLSHTATEKVKEVHSLPGQCFDVKTALGALLGKDYTYTLNEDVIAITPIWTEQDTNRASETQNPLLRAVLKALSAPDIRCTDAQKHQLLTSLVPSYNIYPPMLLLPNHAFDSKHWKSLLSTLKDHEVNKTQFFAIIASEMQVTHIAINAPIPALNAHASSQAIQTTTTENLLRSPTNLTPLHGDFGPALPPFPAHIPASPDFNTAFWVSTRQNGIQQFWAPKYTMFSAGNVTEKARVLHLPSMRRAVEQGERDGRGCAAVDLFAGIGYFAFSYAKAGVKTVLCWDLNPWSVEGLRRGAGANKWEVRVLDGSTSAEPHVMEQDEMIQAAARLPLPRLLVFCESNEYAGPRIERLRTDLAPIRHVNCGMLPSVGEAWKTAVEALDPELGGWLHLHETVSSAETEKRAHRFRAMIANHVLGVDGGARVGWEIIVEHIEKVKSVGPRVWHIVVDIWAGPRQT